MNINKRRLGAWAAALAAAASAAAAEPEGPAKPPPASTITVTGKVRPQQTLIDRKVYKVSGELSAGTASAAELLNMLPSVEVDVDGNLSLRGDRNVLILIDGKPSAQLTGSGAGDALLQFPASMIERIEIMTTAPAQYRSEGTGGVINIVTKKAKADGSSAAAQASLGTKLRSVLGVSGSTSRGDLSLSGGLGLRRDVRRRVVDSTLVTPDPASSGSLTATQHLDELARRWLPSARGALSWQLNSTQSVDADFNARRRTGERHFDQANSTLGADGSLQQRTTRYSAGHDTDLASEQSLRWRWAALDAAHTLDLSWHRTADAERENYTYTNTGIVPAAGLSTDHLSVNHDLGTVDWTADYTHTLESGAQWKLGVALTQNRGAFFDTGDKVDPISGVPVSNPNITNRYEYSGRIDALYLSWQHSLPWASVVAGLRTEHTVVEGLQVTTGERDHQDFRGWYPSLRAEHWIDPQTSLSLGYGKRLSRPDPASLNPFVDHQDIHNLRAGNSHLLPQETQALELRYRREAAAWNFDVTGYERHHRNSVTDIVQVLSADVALATKANLPKSQTRGLEFTVDGSATSQWGYRFSGNAYRSEIDATALGATGLQATTGLNLKATLDYKPSATDTAQVNLSRVGRRLTPQGSIAPVNLVNLGVRHQIDGQTAFVATISDVFNGQRQLRTLVTPALSQTYLRTQPGRIFFFGLNFNFGGGVKKGKASGFDYDS